MSEHNLARAEHNHIDDASVADYLRRHPNFFAQHAELLLHLQIPHHTNNETKTGASSLIERQMVLLREKNQLLQSQLVDMLRTARENETLLQHCLTLAMDLMETASFAELTQSLDEHLNRNFDLCDVRLLLVGKWPSAPQVMPRQSLTELKDQLGDAWPGAAPWCGRMTQACRQLVFGDKEDLQSAGLVQLEEMGVLALASRDPLRFAPDMGTLFLQLIGSLLTRLLRQHRIQVAE